MKFILKENQLRLLKEVKGVSESSIPYINMTYNILEEYFFVLLAEQKSQKENVLIDLHELVPFANKNTIDFLYFPIEEMRKIKIERPVMAHKSMAIS